MAYLFLHGLGQNSHAWNETIKLLNSNLEFDCPDLFQIKNGGVNANPINYDNIYQSLEVSLKQYQEPVHLCGLSLGGILALNYTINHPDRVKSLVLIAAQYKIPKKLMMFQNLIFKLLPNRFFNSMGLAKKNVLELINSMMELNFEADLNKINCPVLILCGEKDRANQKAAVELNQKIENSKFMIIPNAGHEINREKPEILAELLKDYYLN